jgi:arylsulfatase A-like enzyme
VLFRNAFVAAPSCTPSRASLLTGRAVHQLEEGGNLWSFLPSKFATYPDLLEAAGYSVGFTGRDGGPAISKREDDHGTLPEIQFASFADFYKQASKDKPFAFWFGSQDPHRPYEEGSGARSGMNAADVNVPRFLADTPETRSDILDYYFEVQRLDREAGEIVATLEAAGQLDNTVIIFTSDNGMPFHEPRPICTTPARMCRSRFDFRPRRNRAYGRRLRCADRLAPTILEAAGLKPPVEMTGRTLMPWLAGNTQPGRERVSPRTRASCPGPPRRFSVIRRARSARRNSSISGTSIRTAGLRAIRDVCVGRPVRRYRWWADEGSTAPAPRRFSDRSLFHSRDRQAPRRRTVRSA